jgi:iron complex transport system substrate-binding protein
MRFIVLALLAAWTAAASAAVSAVDSDGHRLTLAVPAQRIVSLAPHVTELLFAAGAGAKIVAVSEYSDFPPAARNLPRVASSAGVDIERVLALRPDVVVAWRLEATARSLDRLQSLGVPVFYSEPHRLAEIPGALEALGALAGVEASAKPQAARLRAELGALRAKYRSRPVIDVFYQIAERPLMTINGQQFVSDALALCGGRNVFADASVIAPVINLEAVIARNPEVIVAATADLNDTSWQDAWKRFGTLRAVRYGNLLTLHAEEMHRHGPRAIAATAGLCKLLDEARERSLKAATQR